jgi:hypothetical protein
LFLCNICHFLGGIFSSDTRSVTLNILICGETIKNLSFYKIDHLLGGFLSFKYFNITVVVLNISVCGQDILLRVDIFLNPNCNPFNNGYHIKRLKTLNVITLSIFNNNNYNLNFKIAPLRSAWAFTPTLAATF